MTLATAKNTDGKNVSSRVALLPFLQCMRFTLRIMRRPSSGRSFCRRRG